MTCLTRLPRPCPNNRHLPCLSSSHISCPNSRHLSYRNSNHPSCLNSNHMSYIPKGRHCCCHLSRRQSCLKMLEAPHDPTPQCCRASAILSGPKIPQKHQNHIPIQIQGAPVLLFLAKLFKLCSLPLHVFQQLHCVRNDVRSVRLPFSLAHQSSRLCASLVQGFQRLDGSFLSHTFLQGHVSAKRCIGM